MNAIQAFVPTAIVETFAAFLEFCYIARRNIITEDSLRQLNVALGKFHEARQVFAGTVRPEGPSAFSLPRQHSMVHYFDNIKDFGSPNGLCSSITESKHITAVKRPWRRSNKHMALPQMLRSNQRLDKLAAARADFTARGMLVDSCLIKAIETALDAMEDENSMLVDDDMESESDDELFDDLTGTQGADGTIPNFRDPEPEMDGTNVSNLDDHSHSPHLHSPTPPDDGDNNNDSGGSDKNNNGNNDNGSSNNDNGGGDDDNDNDCGPVESGPLMNEVRFVSRKGL